MFVLKKILNGRINVSEPLRMPCGAAIELAAGDAVKYDSTGKLVKVAADDTAEYVVMADTKCTAATDTVPVILVTKEMLFDVDMATAVTVGKKYQFSGGNSITATAAANGFGAYVMAYADKVATVRLA